MDELQAAWRELRAHVDALGAERQQYLELFEQAVEAYVVSDPYGVIRDANGAAAGLLARRRTALRGKPLAALLALEGRRPFRDFLRAAEADRVASTRSVLLSQSARIAVELAARRAPSGALLIRLRPTF